MQKILLLVIIVAIFGTGSYVVLQQNKAGAPGYDMPTETQQASQGVFGESVTPTPKQYDIDSPNSVTVMVNKMRPLPADHKAEDLYAPNVPLRQSADAENMQVRRIMENDLNALSAAASQAGVPVTIGSAYRSAATQTTLYNGYVAASGQAFADLTSARPGYSEHQTGLAIDFMGAHGCFLEKCFADTPEGSWLATNAHRYGFVLRYPLNKTDITGYDFEPWHFRYIGTEPAAEVYEKGLTLEEYFQTGPAATYKP